MAQRPSSTPTRRQFLLAGGATAAWAMLGGPCAIVNAAVSGKINGYSLEVDYSERELGPFRIRTRTYNSSLPGPLMVTRPGHTLHITLANQLPPDPPASAPPE
jgi:FtsP/CotA-like multicopper oxidase with cupredoxin domain